MFFKHGETERRTTMEELPLGIKIIGLVSCLVMVFLLAAHDKVFGWLRRSPKSPKGK